LKARFPRKARLFHARPPPPPRDQAAAMEAALLRHGNFSAECRHIAAQKKTSSQIWIKIEAQSN